jgi:hypothetical protein
MSAPLATVLPAEVPMPAVAQAARALPSGRSVVVRAAAGGEEIEVRSPSGEVEVRIQLTETGPVVRLRGARLELEAAEDIALRCRRFALLTIEGTTVQSQGDVQLQAEGQIQVRTADDLRLDGKMIYLNS